MNNENNNSIILDKIRKLIALSESPNESEAASALSKVHLLLAKHGLSMTDISCDDTENTVIEKSILNKKRLRNWESALLSTIMNATYTEAVHKPGEGKVCIIGREINVTAAENLFSYLHETIKRISRKYNPVVRHADSFRYGMVVNINERLKALDEKGDEGENQGKNDRQLVVSMAGKTGDENRNYLDETYGTVKKKRINNRVDPESYGLGQKVGNKISLSRQIKK